MANVYGTSKSALYNPNKRREDVAFENIKNALLFPKFPVNHFLDASEQERLVAGLVYYGLIKVDNNRGLPLKKGGFTDVYINIRDSRNNPEAVAFMADMFASAIKRLRVDCFADVPLAVSHLSSSITERTRIPAITIREQEKAGRATQGLIIGSMCSGDRVAIYDDVITDGASKIQPFRVITRHGGTPYLVVMVDRQQGWQQKFAELGITLPVWSGTDLHTVRHHLINTFGVMQRCDPEMKKRNPFVIALDGKPWGEVLPLLDVMRPSGAIFKINDMLHDQSRRGIIRDVGVYGEVMIDFKVHDTPTTVYNTCMQYRDHQPWAVTVHASGGEDMVRAAVKAFEGTPTKVLVVTVLTSIDPQTCEMIYHDTRPEEVTLLSSIGAAGGCHGFVCSGNEVQRLSAQYGNAMEYLVPGTRSPGADAHDQKNVVTHKEALDRGATHLVAGRQFLEAANPIAEMVRVMRQELGIVG